MLNKINALTLVKKALRVIELQPALVLAFVHVNWWTTPLFVIRDIPGGRLSLRNDEGVVYDNIFGGTKVPRSVDTAVHFFESLPKSQSLLMPAASILDREGAALHHVVGVTRVIVPGERLTG